MRHRMAFCAPQTQLTCNHLLRSVTSDVTVADTSHYLETECMREAMEQVLYSNGVDVVLNGHLHEYERTNPVFVSHLLPCLLCAFNTAAEASFTSCSAMAEQLRSPASLHAMLAPELHLQIDDSCAVLLPTLYGMLCLFPYHLYCRHSLPLGFGLHGRPQGK